MFFIISKLLIFLFKPLNWVVALSLFSLFSKNAKRRSHALRGAIIILIFFTNPLIINLIIGKYEVRPVSIYAIEQPYDVGVLLGGFTEEDIRTLPNQPVFRRSGNRLTQTLMLFHNGKIRRVLISSGNGRVLSSAKPEATGIREFLLLSGVPDSAILVEGRSRNTRENAVFSKMLLDSVAPNASCLLITSAIHMPRAAACYRKVGLEFDAFPADFFTERKKATWFNWFEPSWSSLMRWDALIKEWVGYLAYRAKGYV